METKFTKGKWEIDENKTNIKNKNVGGLLITTWSCYNSDEHEQRKDGESWLSMRQRLEPLRNEKLIEQHANALLISKAPEMFDRLKKLVEMIDLGVPIDTESTKQLLKEATEV